jgi:hypothetical protein
VCRHSFDVVTSSKVRRHSFDVTSSKVRRHSYHVVTSSKVRRHSFDVVACALCWLFTAISYPCTCILYQRQKRQTSLHDTVACSLFFLYLGVIYFEVTPSDLLALCDEENVSIFGALNERLVIMCVHVSCG